MQENKIKEQYFLSLSKKRIDKYLNAVNNNFEYAIKLYEINLMLSKEFYTILSFFEIMLRNSINKHYSEKLNDSNWIQKNFINRIIGKNDKEKSILKKSVEQVKKVVKELDNNYSKDKLVSRLNFGFWVNLFNSLQFKVFGQSLHQVFINRPKGLKPKDIFTRLDRILRFRNRIAHYEPIAFGNKNEISSVYARMMYSEIKSFIEMLGFDYSKLIGHLENVEEQLNKLDELKNKIDNL